MEVIERIQSTNKLYYALVHKKEITQITKITVYNTVFKSFTYTVNIYVYGREKLDYNDKIQTVEMKYLRAVKGVSSRDKIK